MTDPTFTTPPTAPSRSDAPTVFSSRSDAFVSWITTFVSEMVSAVTWFSDTTTTVSADKDAAAASAAAASTSETNAGLSEAASASSAVEAENTLTAFEQVYLGAFAIDPTLDNQGNALQTGAIYYNTSSGTPFIYDGGWAAAALDPAGALMAVNNLSDLNDLTTAQTNLGLGTAALLDAGTSANNAVQLDGDSYLPAVDGRNLVGVKRFMASRLFVSASPVTVQDGRRYVCNPASGGVTLTVPAAFPVGSQFVLNMTEITIDESNPLTLEVESGGPNIVNAGVTTWTIVRNLGSLHFYHDPLSGRLELI